MQCAPPQTWTELHRHLDVSIPSRTLFEFAQADGLVSESTSLPQFEQELYLRAPLADLSTVLARFELFPRVLNRPERLERVAFEVATQAYAEQIHRLELRYSPQFVRDGGGLDWAVQHAAFERGLARARGTCPGLQAGLILIATREFGPEIAAQTVEFAIANHAIGVDLAGDETQIPSRAFAQAYAPARAAGLPITIHAGEAAGPESVWEAIESLGARRIGHGITSFQDPELVQRLIRDGICLEMCPTSNWITQCVPSLSDHPIKQALELGVSVCINTDDPGIFGVTLANERSVARSQCGLTEANLITCEKNARDALFLVAPKMERR